MDDIRVWEFVADDYLERYRKEAFKKISKNGIDLSFYFYMIGSIPWTCICKDENVTDSSPRRWLGRLSY